MDLTLQEKAIAQHKLKDESIPHQEMIETLGF